jgi:hypothetical protein
MARPTDRERAMINAQAVNEATFTAAVTDVITSAGHGLSNGEIITVSNSGGALPTGLSANTYYYVIEADTNTFEVSLTSGGTAVDISGTGSGTHTWHEEFFHVIPCENYRFIMFSYNSADGNVNVSAMGSIADSVPDFIADASASNRWGFLDVTDTLDGSSIDGAVTMIITWFAIKTRNFEAGTISVYTKAFG